MNNTNRYNKLTRYDEHTKQDKLTIIIVTRNRAEKLNSCLNSLAAQSVKPYELIIVDNCSTDDTRSVVESYKKKFPGLNIKFLEERMISIPKARNKGLKNSKGEIIAFIDDDCTAPKAWIKNISSVHKRGHDAVFGKILPSSNNIIAGFAQSLESPPSKSVMDYKSSLINNASFKKSSIKGLLFDERLTVGEDVEFNHRLHESINKRYMDRRDRTVAASVYDPSIIIYHDYRESLAGLLRQQFMFGKFRPRLMKIADDYPFDKKNKPIYLLKRIATPLLDPWLRFSYALRNHRRCSICYMILGYMQQAAYWSGFIIGIF